jgi:hypothetical protein
MDDNAAGIFPFATTFRPAQGSIKPLIHSASMYRMRGVSPQRPYALQCGIWSKNNFMFGNPGSSGSIVSDYGLDDRAMEVRSPTGADFSSSLCVQTGSGAHPESYPMGTGGSFPGGKARLGRDADHSPPSSAEVKNE